VTPNASTQQLKKKMVSGGSTVNSHTRHRGERSLRSKMVSGGSTKPFLLLILALCAIPLAVCGAELDENYEILFNSFPATIPRTCSSLSPSVEALGLSGSFILPSVAQFELGGTEFVSVLDGFGKLHRFEFDKNSKEMCFQSKMIGSGFYNVSMAATPPTIAPGILFMDTKPPLKYGNKQKIMGPNDNVYVNTVSVGDKYLSLTDSQFMLEFDLSDLSVIDLVKWSDKLDQMKLSTGSAHAIKRGDCMIDIDPQSNMDGTDAKVIVYELCPSRGRGGSAKFERKELNSYNTSNGYLPYMHSFGLTKNYAILPHQSFYFDYNQIIQGGKPLVEAMIDLSSTQKGFVVKVVPLNGDEEVVTINIDQSEPFYYFHTINSWETKNEDGSTGVVMDLSALSINMLPYFTLEMERTKSIRDASTFGVIIVKRYTMWISGPSAGTWSVESLTDPKRSTDFPNFNRAYAGQKSCIFYALEWFHNSVTYADMAVVKYDTCTGSRLYWHQDNFFPSEPTFVAASGSASGSVNEDDGVLMFSAVQGSTKTSFLTVVNARDMTTIEQIAVPGIVTFTTHGEWFPSS